MGIEGMVETESVSELLEAAYHAMIVMAGTPSRNTTQLALLQEAYDRLKEARDNVLKETVT